MKKLIVMVTVLALAFSVFANGDKDAGRDSAL